MQVHVQGFDCESIFFKKTVNMFQSMEIAENIYEGVVTPSDKKILGKKPKVPNSVRKRMENTPHQILTRKKLERRKEP